MSIRPHIQAELDRTDERIAGLQPHWPAAVALESDLRSAYNFLPYFFLEAFPSLRPEDLLPVSLFGRLLASSIFVHDRLIDRAPASADPASIIARGSLRMMAMQFEAYEALRGHVRPDAPFWARCRSYLAEYSAACLEERRFASGERPWSEYTEEVALQIAVGKNAVSRAVPAGLVELAGDDALLQPLIKVLDAFNKAAQMWDDIQDWKDDLRHGVPSLLVRRVASEPPPRDLDDAAWKSLSDRLAREVYYGGHAFYVIDLARAALDEAESLKPTISDLAWHDTTAIYRRRFDSLRNDIERIVSENVKRARKPPAIELRLPEPASPWQDIAFGALRYLVRQWQLGFGEARDMMRYPKDLKIGPAEKYYFGDVFQRALIADALCDASPLVGSQLDELIEGEAKYLLEQKLSYCRGGWSYFPDQVHLPPDADDLAQIMQVLLRTGHRDDVVATCETPLSILLDDLAHGDGSFETWIVPATDRNQAETRHAELVEKLWGGGADCDVIPNVLHALRLYDRPRFAQTIARGIEYLARRQREDGTWPGRWYHGPYYPLYVNLRVLAGESPAAPGVARGLAFLRKSQREDGGYGLEDNRSDALGTALGLLGLAAVHGIAGEPGDLERATRARDFLVGTRDEDHGWPTQRFLPKGFGVYHGSRTMTTLFVLKAALAWHALASGSRSA